MELLFYNLRHLFELTIQLEQYHLTKEPVNLASSEKLELHFAHLHG